MLLPGVITAGLVSGAWILAHIGWVHLRPAGHRLAAMTVAYLASLPFTWPAFRFVAGWLQTNPAVSPGPGLTLAFLLGLLLYFLFVECFYHVERSVTLRFLVEILRRRSSGTATIRNIQDNYSLEAMIGKRIELLRENGFIEESNGRWVLRPKGRRFCRLMAFSCWLFQSKTQDQRL